MLAVTVGKCITSKEWEKIKWYKISFRTGQLRDWTALLKRTRMSLKSSSCLLYHSSLSLALLMIPFLSFFSWRIRLPKAFFRFSSPSREERISLLFWMLRFIRLFLCLDSSSSLCFTSFISLLLLQASSLILELISPLRLISSYYFYLFICLTMFIRFKFSGSIGDW